MYRDDDCFDHRSYDRPRPLRQYPSRPSPWHDDDNRNCPWAKRQSRWYDGHNRRYHPCDCLRMGLMTRVMSPSVIPRAYYSPHWTVQSFGPTFFHKRLVPPLVGVDVVRRNFSIRTGNSMILLIRNAVPSRPWHSSSFYDYHHHHHQYYY